MDETPIPKIQEYLSDLEGEMVSYLRHLLELESPSVVPETQQQILNTLGKTLENIDFQVEIIPGVSSGGHLMATSRAASPGKPEQLLLGHCDTVWPLGTLHEMPVMINGNRIHGPGVFDMKAGLVQMVFALRALHAQNIIPTVLPRVFINSDEEIGSQESTPLIAELSQKMDRVLVLEPALGPEGKLKTARKGVGRFTIKVEGIPAHSGLEPEKGASAILELSYLIQKLFALNDPARGISVNVGLIEGGLRPNVIAPASKAIVDVRVPTRADVSQVEELIYNLQPSTPNVSLKIEGRISRMPMEKTARNRALWRTAKELAETLSLDLEDAAAGGSSDGNTSSLYTATLDGLGAVGDGAHARHEFIYIDKMLERTALLALLLLSPSLNHS